jgi:cation:H+ antiporter
MNSQIALDSFFVFIGFALMILGAERLVKGASALAVKLNLSKAFIGAVLVGFGTSAPEFFASIYSASIGEGMLATGNVIGSNVFNSTLVMATCLLFPFIITKAERHYSNWIMIILPALMVVFFLKDLELSRLEGLLLLVPLPIFFYTLLKQGSDPEEIPEVTTDSIFINSIWVIVGILGLYFGSDYAVAGSLEVADHFGLSKGFAGAIILATGTSLPELITTIIAGIKKEISLALANIVGSNALNIFGVLGISAALFPFSVEAYMGHQNTFFLLLISFMLLPLLIIRSNVFHKLWALILFALYIVFFAAN